MSLMEIDAGEDAYACAEIALAAMRETGTADVLALSAAIGVRITRVPGGVAVPPPVAGAISRRATGTRPPTPGTLRFAMRGSTGNVYDLVLEERVGGPALRCTCTAGRFGVRCRHVKALEVGDVTDLLSENFSDVALLARRRAAS